MSRSTNGGVDWTPVNGLLGNHDVLSLAIDPTNPSILYAGTSDSLWKTSNAATWWEEVGGFTTRIEQIVLGLQNPSVVYVVHGQFFNLQLARSDNGGTSFAPKTPGPALRTIALVSGNPSVVYAGGSKVWRSGSQGNVSDRAAQARTACPPVRSAPRAWRSPPSPATPGGCFWAPKATASSSPAGVALLRRLRDRRHRGLVGDGGLGSDSCRR